jgi:ABC-type dipeptide/oligopeptide/nickel transport system permease subunit
MAQQRQGSLPTDTPLSRDSGFERSGVATLPVVETEQLPPQVSSPGRDAWRRFRKNWAAMLSLSVILILIFIATFAHFMHTADPLGIEYGNLDAGPSPQHWFGTDGLGRDQYSRLIYGLRVPLIVGIIGAAVTTIIGSLIGVIAAYAGGFVDTILSRFTDLIFAFPAFLLALLSVSLFGQALDPYFGGAGRVILLTVIFAAVGWPFLMRFVRSLALSLKEQQFVEAARTSGTSSWRILVRHLLPNMYGLILVQAGFLVVGFVYNEAVLSILGLGVQPPNPDLGVMLFNGSERLGYNAWEVAFPSIFITIIILAFTFLGDGVRDAVDPRGNK